MESMIYILLLCVVPPLLLTLAFVDRRARLYIGFIVVGFLICFVASGVDGLLLAAFGNDTFYVTTTITPITEEILKALPIIVYAFAFDDDRKKLVTLALLVGAGFAIMENLVILLQNYASVDLFWAAVRGFASASIHGICTGMVALGLSFVRKNKKLFLIGTFALLTAAMTVHSIYNVLVQSDFYWLGYVFPILIYANSLVYAFEKVKNIHSGILRN